jgi:hypothetical protein
MPAYALPPRHEPPHVPTSHPAHATSHRSSPHTRSPVLRSRSLSASMPHIALTRDLTVRFTRPAEHARGHPRTLINSAPHLHGHDTLSLHKQPTRTNPTPPLAHAHPHRPTQALLGSNARTPSLITDTGSRPASPARTAHASHWPAHHPAMLLTRLRPSRSRPDQQPPRLTRTHLAHQRHHVPDQTRELRANTPSCAPSHATRQPKSPSMLARSTSPAHTLKHTILARVTAWHAFTSNSRTQGCEKNLPPSYRRRRYRNSSTDTQRSRTRATLGPAGPPDQPPSSDRSRPTAAIDTAPVRVTTAYAPQRFERNVRRSTQTAILRRVTYRHAQSASRDVPH